MSHPRWTLARNCVFNNGQGLLSIARRDEQDREAHRVGGAYLLLAKHGLFAEGSRQGHFFDFDDGHLLLTGMAGVKFGNDSRTLS